MVWSSCSPTGAADGGLGLSFKVRTTWKNHLENQSLDPLRIYYEPEDIEQVAAIVQEAENTRVTVRAIGSGHSRSDVALTTGYIMETSRLVHLATPEPNFIRPAWEGRRLLRAEADVLIKELNPYLDRSGLALSNMGGYDHQTLAGVISTSKYGSCIIFGPLNDFVRSLDLVTSGGRIYRIERADGATTEWPTKRIMERATLSYRTTTGSTPCA